MEEARSFGPLLIVVTLAFVVPLLLSTLRGRFAIPIVVGEIVAGIIVGRSGFAWVLPDNSELILLKELGFCLPDVSLRDGNRRARGSREQSPAGLGMEPVLRGFAQLRCDLGRGRRICLGFDVHRSHQQSVADVL